MGDERPDGAAYFDFDAQLLEHESEHESQGESESEDDGESGSAYFTYVDSTVSASADPAPVMAAGYWPDGSRTWRFVASGDPRKWSDLAYIDENVAEVMALGWIEPNPEGAFWTVEQAIQAFEAWQEAATEPYRYADYGDEMPEYEHQQAETAYAQTSAAVPVDAAQAVPPAQPEAPAQPDAPAPPDAPEWHRAADPRSDGTSYDDVMAELRQRVPENDGRWTATTAATFDGDQAFLAEQGISGAQDRARAAMAAASSDDGVMTPEGFLAVHEAGGEAMRAQISADSSRNRYQQSTDFQPEVSAEEQLRAVDDGLRMTREAAAADPESFGLNMTFDQQRDYAEAQEYASRTGVELDPRTPLTAEQRAYLEELRAADSAEAARRQAEWDATPEGAAARAAADQRARYAMTEQDRVAESRQRAEERMQRSDQ